MSYFLLYFEVFVPVRPALLVEGAQDVLTRDVARVDMRLAHRPTVRMTDEATENWWQIKELSGQ